LKQLQDWFAKKENAPMVDAKKRVPMFTPKEVAKALAISEKTVWKKIYARDIGSVKIGTMRRIPAEALDEFIERSSVPALESR